MAIRTQTTKKLFKVFVYNIAFAFSLWLAYKSLDLSSITNSNIQVDWILIVAALIPGLLFYMLLSFGWQRFVSLYKTDTKGIYTTFLSTQIYKYLPSSLFIFSFRVIHAKKFGISAKSAASAVLIEHLFLVYTGVLIFLVFNDYLLLALLILLISYITIYFKSSLNSFLSRLKIEKFVPLSQFTYSLLTQLYLLYLLSWVSIGFSLYLFNVALGFESSIFKILSYQAISTVAGILAIFAPGGLGVREIILSYSSLTAAAIVGWRIFTIFMELIVTVAGISLEKREISKRQGNSSN